MNEAEVEIEQFNLVFSDDEMGDLSSTVEDRLFIDDSRQEEDRSFYRDLNKTGNPVVVVNEPEEEYYRDYDLPEMHDPENREQVNFDSYTTDKAKTISFKNSLVCFPNVENHFIYAVIYRLMQTKLKNTLGDDFFLKLKQVVNSVMLDHSIFGYF